MLLAINGVAGGGEHDATETRDLAADNDQVCAHLGGSVVTEPDGGTLSSFDGTVVQNQRGSIRSSGVFAVRNSRVGVAFTRADRQIVDRHVMLINANHIVARCACIGDLVTVTVDDNVLGNGDLGGDGNVLQNGDLLNGELGAVLTAVTGGQCGSKLLIQHVGVVCTTLIRVGLGGSGILGGLAEVECSGLSIYSPANIVAIVTLNGSLAFYTYVKGSGAIDVDSIGVRRNGGRILNGQRSVAVEELDRICFYLAVIDISLIGSSVLCHIVCGRRRDLRVAGDRNDCAGVETAEIQCKSAGRNVGIVDAQVECGLGVVGADAATGRYDLGVGNRAFLGVAVRPVDCSTVALGAVVLDARINDAPGSGTMHVNGAAIVGESASLFDVNKEPEITTFPVEEAHSASLSA